MAILLPLLVGFAGTTAEARSLQLGGTAGYLSEWAISGTVSDGGSGAAGSLSGPVTLTHTGLCAVKGPVERSGEMSVTVSGWGPFAQVEVSMRFPTTRCVFRGRYGEVLKGAMDCSDAAGVPVELSVK